MYPILKRIHTRPELFGAYTAETLWNDPHTSQQTLAFHLDPDIEDRVAFACLHRAFRRMDHPLLRLRARPLYAKIRRHLRPCCHLFLRAAYHHPASSKRFCSLVIL